MSLAGHFEAHDPSSNRNSTNVREAKGTLMWIGETDHAEFRPAYQYCVANAAQVAIRRDINDALRRSATDVRCILLARKTQDPVPESYLAALTTLYPESSTVSLWGALGEGVRDGTCTTESRLYWHRWNQMLPNWLAPCGAATEATSCPAQSVAVLASTFSAAEPLIELAESTGATVVWSSRPDTRCVRNVEVVWWDDSIAQPGSSAQWRHRLAQIVHSRPKQHAWIANSPRIDQYQQATLGGIDVIVSKPHQIDCLLRMLDSGQGGQEWSTTQELKAA